MISTEQYEIERAICDKAQAYWKEHATFTKGGWSSMGPELLAHPDYAACDNAMRGRVEQYELAQEKPDKLFAYVSKDQSGCWFLATWAGDVLSTDLVMGRSFRNPRPSFTSNTLTPIRVKTIWGDWYAGKALGAGIYVKLRKIKAQD